MVRKDDMYTVILGYPELRVEETSIEGKFLQLNHAYQDYLLFAAATELRFHNQLLARFLAERAIPHHWVDEQTLVVDEPGLVVSGGGRFRLDGSRNKLWVWDESGVYGRFDPSRLARQLAAAGEPWNGLTLDVG